MGDNKYSGILGVLGIIGCIAAFFVLKSSFPVLAMTVLVGGILCVVFVIAVVVAVLVLAFKKPTEKEGDQTHQEMTTVQKEGRAKLIELRRVGMKIKNQTIRKENDEICEAANKIIRELKDHKENLPEIRRFLNYYLPTLGKILKNYEKLETSGVVEDEITENTIKCMADIKAAMEKQYQNLFEKYVLDMSIEMEALTLACKRDGLILENDESEEITLTL